jgi:hypothetical protein
MTAPAAASEASARAAGTAAGGTLLIVHAGPPWQANGGSVFLDQFAALAEQPCVHLVISLEGRPMDVPASFPRPVVQVAARGGVRGVGVIQRRSPWGARHLYWGAAYPRVLARATRRAVDAVRAINPSHAIIVLNALEVPVVARALLAELAVPYSTMEWDLLDGPIVALGLVEPLQRRELARVAGLRAGAASRGVASEGMSDYYRSRWSLDSLVLRQTATRVARRPAAAGAFVIAVCGNVYAGPEFRVLLEALERLGWTLDGRPVEVRVIGQVVVEVGPLPPTVSVSGWVSYEESLARLASADLGYCPYWFDPQQATVVATSFPSKFISYLTCGLPVFYHGPTTGTPAGFLARYPAGVACHSLDPAAVAEALAGFAASPDRLHAARLAADQAVDEELSTGTLRGRIASLLGR